ncbi:integrase-recombinase protein : Uncultured bacterium genome assembly Metasoil_fosmids_resub OS=uncultured bacterium PE=4 SV=1: Phage_integrase [Gemmata massiliana]|uniref:Tyr recombinase domain-containing protein n=1 Tax=Gemmata massiliana TaxID=1210884 RepID=A0A6P2CSU8_9BACT|nr:integrase-recombinase protein : Uncultured bacterium genome assembly Metasoil_fosmids_resub OS=uncultured bacterium PE=4 SV=1: Phage_integrase [Gemmata massiliana]
MLNVARTRPLDSKLAINRGGRKGQAGARLTDATRAALIRAGCERALVYKTLVLTGLRKSELESITVGQVRLDDRPHIALAAADEKARRGALVPLRTDLADDLRNWLAERLDEVQSKARLAGQSIPPALPSDTLLFCVLLHLIRNLKKDLTAAGIPVRDDQGFVIDPHSMRHTLATMLAKGGAAPRITQELMRHSDPRLTANVYTHLGLSDTRSALDSLPSLSGSVFAGAGPLAPQLALTPYKRGQNGPPSDKLAESEGVRPIPNGLDAKPGNVNENSPPTTAVISGPSQIKLTQEVAAVGFEPTTSRLLHLNKLLKK